MTTTKTVTVCDQYGDKVMRLKLGSPAYTGPRRETNTGVFDRALYIGRKHVILHTYSIWSRRDGTVDGDAYCLATADSLHHIKRVYGAEAEAEVARVLQVPVYDLDGQAVSK